ncbi:hypothetical protein HHO41_00570 [Bacillus sp. DNRA2]|uniref:hypothetical protein n=1 Tax=Bacillus sp. DNRA2 TaxID=2723053 RepID=UPI00145F6FD0|nr:hypothetical protein [Bacillus sp. DNRA2]NMD68762.1 hypothetical protein [Bacillus sp. DNRA2]
MKGYLSLMFGSLIIAVMLMMPGNSAQAEEPVTTPSQESEDGHCGCDVEFLTGAQRNKIAAELNSSDAFKVVKNSLEKQGYEWNGSGATEIIINHSMGDVIFVGAMFTAEDGLVYAAGYLYNGGQFINLGIAPY